MTKQGSTPFEEDGSYDTRIENVADGLPIEVTVPDGRTRQMRFDERGLPLEDIAPTGASLPLSTTSVAC
ncbi:hypothetical protein [Halomonas denitrificans]|uniref:hypothetical protein n=1 Tax=Halomonas denitrificans TaxID=370769 RepID=UPI001C9962D1|nr:hypothetical protein [Halomonas denitrificans]MBY5969684.1 hypothetical protein [Halomonas denitrificans]